MSTQRLSLTGQGLIHYRLKTPYRDGTTHGVFEPLDKIAVGGPKGWRAGCPEYFIARLAALVPNPRVNLTRYHGVFAPHHHLRSQMTPAQRGRRPATRPQASPHARTLSEFGFRRSPARAQFNVATDRKSVV